MPDHEPQPPITTEAYTRPLPTAPYSPTTPPAFPCTFDRYEILAELGEGGMGVVYKARDTVLKRDVALKVLRGGPLAGRVEILRFFHEAEAGARFRDPHILPVLDIGRHAGVHYFTTPLAASSLDRCLEQYAEPRRAARLIATVARAVQKVHDGGILHRDLKPPNILLGYDGEPWVADFGLAKFFDESTAITEPNIRLGTLAYMAPELLRAVPEKAGAAADIWALGVTLYQLLTGRRPFTGTTVESLTQQIRNAEPPPLHAHQSAIEPDLAAVVFKCLEKDQSRRYASAAALAEDLERWQRGEPTSARPPRWPARAWRLARRRARVLVPLLLVAAAATWATTSYLHSPERQLARLQARLAQHEAVPLLGDDGAPAWWRVVEGEQVSTLKAGRGEPFAIVSSGACLVDLLPEPAPPAYWLRAEVMHRAGRDAKIGLYCARTAHPDYLATPVHSLLALTFRDIQGSPAARYEVGLRPTLYWKTTPEPGQYSEADLATLPIDPAAEFPKPSAMWRRLAVRVTSRRAEMYWQDASAGEVHRDVLRIAGPRLVAGSPSLRNLRPDFLRAGALGLVVYKGEAWFRRINVEPIPDE